MSRKILIAAVFALLCHLSAGFAADVDNGRLQVKPYKGDRFRTGAYIMGKMELFGYVGDLKDSAHITGIVLLDGDDASANQKHLIAVIAKSQHMNAFIEMDDKTQPLVDPKAGAAPESASAPGASSTAPDGG